MSIHVVKFPAPALHTPESLANGLKSVAEQVKSGEIPEISRIHILVEHDNSQLTYLALGKDASTLHRVGVFSVAAMVTAEPPEG